jgi:integrative and conjugative element protein (TIGR02256 family)
MQVELKGIKIIVSEMALTIFENYKQREREAVEAGGVVFGQVSQDEHTILIARVSIPGPYDKATRTSFHRDKVWAQGITDYEFINSSGRNIYLGEWHTHPAKHARPSRQDQHMLAEQYRENDIQTPFLLLFIVGLDEILSGLYDGHTLLSTKVRFERKQSQG